MYLSELRVLSDKEIREIHEASLAVLEETGLVVESEELAEYLGQNDCNVDMDTLTVRFPRAVVEKAIGTAPGSFPLLDRSGKEFCVMGEDPCLCGSGHNAIFTPEGDEGARREATLKDVYEFSVLSDRLSEVDIIGVPYSPQDVNKKTSLLYAIKQILEVSEKPIFFSCESEEINYGAVKMCKSVLGVDDIAFRSNMISQLSTTSPLYWERGAAKALHLVAREGMPVAFLPQPITGMTAPYTLAGILTLQNIEVLSGVTIAQLVRPEVPVVYACAWTTYDMKRLNVLIGRPEASLLRIAGAQMAHYYEIPSHTTAPDNDSNFYDEQGSWEKLLSTFAAIAGGNDMLMNMGMFGTGMSISNEQLVMDNEICRIVRRFARGIEVTPETIAKDVIKSVGPRDMYLAEEHTLDYLRSGEHVTLDVSYSGNFGNWEKDGMPLTHETARKEVARLLAEGPSSLLDAGAVEKLAAIIKETEELYG